MKKLSPMIYADERRPNIQSIPNRPGYVFVKRRQQSLLPPSKIKFELADRSALISGNQRLKIFLRPAFNPAQRLVQVLHGVGNREAQIAFAERPERRAGKTGHSGVVQQCLRQLARLPARLPDVRESVKRSVRQPATEARDLVQSGDKLVAPRAELLAHVVNRRLVALDRLNTGHLGKCSAARIDIGHQAAKVDRKS